MTATPELIAECREKVKAIFGNPRLSWSEALAQLATEIAAAEQRGIGTGIEMAAQLVEPHPLNQAMFAGERFSDQIRTLKGQK